MDSKIKIKKHATLYWIISYPNNQGYKILDIVSEEDKRRVNKLKSNITKSNNGLWITKKGETYEHSKQIFKAEVQQKINYLEKLLKEEQAPNNN